MDSKDYTPLEEQARKEAEEKYPITVVREPGGGEYFYVQCNNNPCSLVFFSRDAHGCHPIADTGDFSEMRCPLCSIIADDECHDLTKINAARFAYAAGLIAARQQDAATIAALRAEVEGLKDAGNELKRLLWEANDMAILGPKPSDDWHNTKRVATKYWTALTTKTD